LRAKVRPALDVSAWHLQERFAKADARERPNEAAFRWLEVRPREAQTEQRVRHRI
jgi:hypothetical protein